MIEVKIPQEINQYEAKMVGPFTIRQAICGGIGIAASWWLYNGLKDVLPQETTVGIILLLCVPLGLIGWIKPYGMKFEKFFMGVLFNTLISNPKRYFQSPDVMSATQGTRMDTPPEENEATYGKGKKKKGGKKEPKKPRVKKATNKKYKKNTYF